ncbi:hypothetical protein [Mesobacillus maritimus]|uniref:hypothetical protein n=1 Tax=Mesobacillus maritimus TaxID=1643336 RepID=UPI00384C7A39
MNAFQLGPFIIKHTWLYAILALVITYFLLKKLLNENQDFLGEFLDALVNSLFIGVLSFKASILLYRPELLTTNPLGALYLSGGLKEWLTAISLALLYMYWKAKKNKWPARLTMRGIVYGIVTFITAFWLLRTLFLLVI